MRPATVERLPESPALAPDFLGITLALGPRSSPAEPVLVHGSFRVPWPDADRIEPPRHRALVLVVTSAAGYSVSTPFREQVLFPDDETATHAGPLGHFNLDIGALLGKLPEREAFAFVSLGPLTSNVVRIAPT